MRPIGLLCDRLILNLLRHALAPNPEIMNVKLLFVLILMLVVTLFSVQNAEVITVRFLHWQFAMSQALVIMLTAICGALGGVVLGALARRKKPEQPEKTPPPKKV